MLKHVDLCKFQSISDFNNERIEKVIIADPVDAANRLAEAMRSMHWDNAKWEKEVHHMKNDTPPKWDTHATSDSSPMHPLRVCAAVQPYIAAGGVFVTDGGEFGQWASAGLQGEITMNSSPDANVGCAIPLAIAAKLVYPDKPVFALTGDGGFGYHMAELDTAMRYELPIIVVVGNDAKWNAEYHKQKERYRHAVETELRYSRYDEVARALDAHGALVKHPQQLRETFEHAVQNNLCSCINIHVQGHGTPKFKLAGE